MEKLYTIGHSQHPIEYFAEMLNTHNINYILDVRSTPFSQFASDYNKDKIRLFLYQIGIQYAFMGEYFGARQKDSLLYSDEGYLDFEKVKESKKFIQAKESIIKGIEQGNKIALMCTEKDPIDCHRAILVANAFYENGIEVEHILHSNKLQSHEILNDRLLSTYYPDRNQLSLFDSENFSETEYLKRAYREQNKKIGYQMDDVKGRVVVKI